MPDNEIVFPKVLILGQTFNLSSGSGITKTNLFMGWPKDSIAVATYETGLLENKICDKFYLLGDKEHRYWKIYKVKEKSRAVTLNTENIKPDETVPRKITHASSVKGQIHLLRNFFIRFWGLHYRARRLVVSDELTEWINQFKPDCLYTNLHEYRFMKFTDELAAKTGIPLVIHIMDDWMPAIEPFGLFHYYWLRKTDNLFRKLIGQSALNLSICQYMSDVYLKRYKTAFIPFHNCVDITEWLPDRKNNTAHSENFVVLYAGRIGPGTSTSVLDIAMVIERLAARGSNIRFEVQANNMTPQFIARLKKLKYTKINNFLPYAGLPEKYKSVQLLVLPMDKDKFNLSYIHLSMPTKVPEYMACGTPTMVYAPKNTALYEYARSSGWAHTIVNDGKISNLTQALKDLYSNENLRKELTAQAIKIVHQNHDRDTVKRTFQNTIAERVLKKRSKW